MAFKLQNVRWILREVMEAMMKVFVRSISVLLLAALSLPVIFISGCGSLFETSAPQGSTIAIDPSSMSFSGSPGTGCTGQLVDEPSFDITVLDDNKLPMNDAVIYVELDWSANTASVQCMTLVDGDTGVDVTSPYRTTTGSFGTKNMKVKMDLGTTYKGSLRVYSGTAFGSADLSSS